MSEVSMLRPVESDQSDLSAVSDVPQPANDVVSISSRKKIPLIEFEKYPPKFGHDGVSHHEALGLPKRWRFNAAKVGLVPAIGQVGCVIKALRHVRSPSMNAHFTAFLQEQPHLVYPDWIGIILIPSETVFCDKAGHEWVVGLSFSTKGSLALPKRQNFSLRSSFPARSYVPVYRP